MNKDCDNFRAIVMGSGISLVLAASYSFFSDPYSEEIKNAASWSGFDALLSREATSFLYLSWLSIYAVAHVLAFFFFHYARWLIIAALLIQLFSAVVSGVFVSTPIENVLWAIQYTVHPFFVGMAFFSPGVRDAFSGDALQVSKTALYAQAQRNILQGPGDGS